ncbi:dihydrouridine synthase (Dus) domain-containing protein [Ditylenchus destructor]|nr:dihydrouridine synthase (Dus) domain-containing protein [Ditylenchus destructor]
MTVSKNERESACDDLPGPSQDEESKKHRISHERRRIIRFKSEDCKQMDLGSPLFICAPMVRYSKYSFRQLVYSYGCDLAYTPMIYAHCFLASQKSRDVEFPSVDDDNPIVQFAANKPEDFASAAELVFGRSRGIDLNCGCPKHDVRKDGFGSKLLDDPELVWDIVRHTRARISDPNFTVSTKIRIQYPIRKTVDLCQKLEHAGVSHIAVHGRTKDMRDHEIPDFDSIATIKAAVGIPVYANGGCKSYDDALEIAQKTKVDGIMAANGILANPAMFGGHARTPSICIEDWLNLGDTANMPFDPFHRHLMFMLRPLLPKQKRIAFNDLKSIMEDKEFLLPYLYSC